MIVGGSKANVQRRYMRVYTSLWLGISSSYCVNNQKKKRKKNERNEEDGESSSNDHIFVVDDTVHDCLLKLDIFHSRHVLGKRGRITERKRDDTQKTGANEKKRGLRKKVRDYGRSLLLQRLRERERRKGLFLLILYHEHHGGHEFQKTTFRMFTFRFSL